MKEKEEKYSTEDMYLFRHLDTNHPIASAKQREIAIFCRTLYSHMSKKDKFNFVWSGFYHSALMKTYKELLNIKKDTKLILGSELDSFTSSKMRMDMTKLCSNLLSIMKRFNRFLFIIAGMYGYPLQKTHNMNRKKLIKDQKRKVKILERMNKKQAKKGKK